MNIVQYFKYEKDGIVGVSITVPDGAEVLETMDILVAEGGYDLIRISDDKNVGNSVWLRNGDVQENYKEVEHKEKPLKKERNNG